ncbi:MAG: nicotinamide-nucleotide amidohydrolase family protein [Steroidobacteraceae bacterium]|nr:nicotinamide-nucleotide amidohydrolase family protein [Nevskiaceae bacterium]MCP5340101.1 nicotinamide-nucleotide amidohydrolase family protein [Nevskiaceae bacterium]MCP5359288.1 nicotinamide-nucleotide amidohydrolase family protein [Nevskiaceae bacterium]MCP5466517.1 nicotinamide-nucleotide amidohydrolase family protein [Nevskiaceae bacterium]MCP5471776.1 nicotinamide-nucleotide amidohydrolase family protein [Nevskiaceae bacterium]
MAADEDLLRLSVRTGRHLLAAGLKLATAESCTAGWIAKLLTDVPGSSDWFDSGYVCYSNAAKRRDLGVAEATLATQGAVSEPAVREMAVGALERTGVGVALAVSGIAGPTGAVPGKPVGTVWFALAYRRGQAVEITTRVKFFKGDRDAVRRKAVQFALQLVLALELPAAAR